MEGAWKRAAKMYKGQLDKANRNLGRYRRRHTPKEYQLMQFNRERVKRFNPEFIFQHELPKDKKVLVVLPHHHEVMRFNNLIHSFARNEGKGPRNEVKAVVMMPGHRSISEGHNFKTREEAIDAVRREGLDWAYVTGLDLGVKQRDPDKPITGKEKLPPESAYAIRRLGDQFIYGPSGAYRFFNAWKTYDSGEKDPNKQRVDPIEQERFTQMVREEKPDIVVLPDALDPHPSHRTTREMTMEALRAHLREEHLNGKPREITLMETPSLQLATPPRFNLWFMAPKEGTKPATESMKVFKLQKTHDMQMSQMMDERVASMEAGDEFEFAQNHPEKFGFSRRLGTHIRDKLASNITGENLTVSRLRVTHKKGVPIVKEDRVDSPREHLLPKGKV